MANICFIYGYAIASGREYQWRSSGRRIPNKQVFINVHRHWSEKGYFPKDNAERSVQQELYDEETILNIVKKSVSNSVRRKIFYFFT